MMISKQIPIILLGSIFAFLIFGFASVSLAASRSASATISGNTEVPSNTSTTTGSLSLYV